MPKMKTNSGAKKRFRFTGTGKIKRAHAYHSHILTKKTKKQKRNLVHDTIVDVTNREQVRELLCLRQTISQTLKRRKLCQDQ
jgi:large subunit ribosomal protein L35